MLKEIYNDNNLKVYADSDEYKAYIYRSYFADYYVLTRNRIYTIIEVAVKMVKDCIITVQGNKLIIEGELKYGRTEGLGLDITLKGDISLRVESGHNTYSCVYTLYGNTELTLGGYNSPQNHTCFLYDNSRLAVSSDAQGTCEIIAYDNAKVVTYGGLVTSIITLYNKSTANVRVNPSPEIYAYDNSTVFSYGDNDENIHLFDNANHSSGPWN